MRARLRTTGNVGTRTGLRRSAWLAVVVCLALTSSSFARTIVLTDEDCEMMAAIAASAPRLSWAGSAYGIDEFSNHNIDISLNSSFLIKYPLDRIPKGQKITKAEWIVPITQAYPNAGVRVQVRRLLKDWGVGVCYDRRMARPTEQKWQTPGARGVGQGRAAKATAIGILKGSATEYSFNVTEDVELWYSQAVPHYGWILTSEDEPGWVRMSSPFWLAPQGWKLKITFEPE